MIDPDDIPVLDEDFFTAAHPANQVLGPDAIARFKAKAGRPKSETPKQAVSIRLDQDVLIALKADGPKWQSRVNAILRGAVIGPKSDGRKRKAG